jgi:tetratricopeptide (TPR) repeat protein
VSTRNATPAIPVKSASQRPQPKPWIAYALLCGLVLAAYANSFHLGFALDGQSKALEDPRVQAATAQNLRLIFTKHYWWPRPTDRLYRPVTLASYLFNYAILGNGANAAGYHIVNVLLHLLNACLLFELAFLVLKNRETAFWAAALWAVHPVQTEAVTNIAGRADLLSGACLFGGLLLYIRSIRLTGRRKSLWLAALFLVAVLGEFSKENAAALAGLMVLWDVAFGWKENQGWRPRQLAYFLIGCSLCLLAAIRWKVFEGEPWPETLFLDNPIHGAGFLEGRLTALTVVARYLGLLVWPARLSFDYAYNQVPLANLSSVGPWLCLLLLSGIAALVIGRYHTDRIPFWAAGFFGIALLPVSNLVFPIGAIMALRFLYVPSAGFAIAAAALAWRLRRPQITRIALALVVILLMARTLARNPVWRDNAALGAADVLSAPASFRTHQVLARALYESDPKGKLDQAIREYEASFRLIQGLPPADSCADCLTELGMFYYAKAVSVGGDSTLEGRKWFQQAAAMLEQAQRVMIAHQESFDQAQIAHGLRSRSQADIHLYLYLARSYNHLGRINQALQTYREAQWINPEQREVYDEMATIYADLGKLEQAAILMDEKAFVLGVNSATAASLRNLYALIPGGACALKLERGVTALNLECPRVRADLCLGWAELDAAYRAAYQPLRADALRAAAIQRYGCPAGAFISPR